MALTGSAFLALWNDITRTREPEYDQWHSLEHVPERVSVTGFHGARRYVNRDRALHRYFTLYDVQQLDVFNSAEYQDLLDNPTPWSASMRPDFSNFVRAICKQTFSSGTGMGAAIACLCLPASIDEKKRELALHATLSEAGVNAVHAGQRTQGAAAVPFSQRPPDTATPRDFDQIVLIEALDHSSATRALEGLKIGLGMADLASDFGADVYDLVFVFPAGGDDERQRHRRPTWPTPPP